jgi:hypothetical protein
VNVLIIAPNTSNVDTLVNIIDAASGQATIITSDNDSALRIALFGHISVSDLVAALGEDDNLLIIQT